MRETDTRQCAIVIAIAAAFCNTADAGPISPLYLSTGTSIEVLQGTTLLDTWTTGEQEFSIAVAGTVKSWSQGNPSLSLLGHEYTLDGVPTGASYLNGVGCCFRDGTTDGQYNYAVRLAAGSTPIYRFNLDWTDPQLVPVQFPFLAEETTGIAYDPTDDTLWLALAPGNIAHIRKDGTLISTSPTGIGDPPNVAVSIGYDRADDTLWLYIGRTGGRSELVQFSAEDTNQGKFALSRQPHASLVYAIDFRLQDSPTAVPDPGSFFLCGIGLLTIARLRARTQSTKPGQPAPGSVR